MKTATHAQIANTIRMMAVDAIQAANSGHPGAPMGLADVAHVLWSRHLRFDPTDPSWPGRDRFVLSGGHASMLLYAQLHLWGFDVSLDDIKAFRQWGSKTPGHPEFGHTPGVEATTGPLGQGVANAVGMALAAKLIGARVNVEADELQPIEQRVFALCGDGDLMEGVSAEAAALAGHWRLDNLVCLYDDNKITIDGDTSLALSEDMAGRFTAAGWHVQAIDGHDPEAIDAALTRAIAHTGQPALIICRTHIGWGSPNRVDTNKVHGSPLGEAELALTREALGWPAARFHVPEAVADFFQIAADAKAAERQAWEACFCRWRDRQPEAAARYDALLAQALPEDLAARLIKATPASGATRKLSEAALNAAAEALPFFIGGSADLTGSNGTAIKGGGLVGHPEASSTFALSFAHKQIPFGVREHAMAAITNGILFHGGLRPFGATFLAFSDYQRGALRVAALSKLPNLFVLTHDSVFLGEDGPTHQPVEHHWALRAIPNLDYFRPADGLETAMAWCAGLRRLDGPTALSLTRQDLPALTRPEGFDPEEILRGGYALNEIEAPEVILVATGSEVALCVEAAARLSPRRVRVVSMPCFDRFERQDEAYREALIPSDHPQVVTVEAGITGPWAALTGRRGLRIGLDTFGFSAPAERIAEEIGLTAEAIAARVQARL
ncbi:transketolase [Myxococcota bacterium]|nr:transketolase [Myxococcota bacterium]MBU1900717.1 transketolase [Myxococcota bacterium]